MSAMLCVAIVNYFVITISDNVLDLAKDFTALLVIGDFDDMLSTKTTTYATHTEIAADVYDNSDDYEAMFKIEVTTSASARSIAE